MNIVRLAKHVNLFTNYYRQYFLVPIIVMICQPRSSHMSYLIYLGLERANMLSDTRTFNVLCVCVCVCCRIRSRTTEPWPSLGCQFQLSPCRRPSWTDPKTKLKRHTLTAAEPSKMIASQARQHPSPDPRQPGPGARSGGRGSF